MPEPVRRSSMRPLSSKVPAIQLHPRQETGRGLLPLLGGGRKRHIAAPDRDRDD